MVVEPWRFGEAARGEAVESERLETRRACPGAIGDRPGLVLWCLVHTQTTIAIRLKEWRTKMAPPTWMEKEKKRSGKEFGGRRSLGKAKEHHQHRLASEMLRWDRGGSHVVFTLGFSFQRDSSSEMPWGGGRLAGPCKRYCCRIGRLLSRSNGKNKHVFALLWQKRVLVRTTVLCN